MWELVDRLHKALDIESTWAFVLVMGLICAASFGILGAACAWIVDAGYKNSAEYKSSHGTTPSPKTEAVTVTVAPNYAATAQPKSVPAKRRTPKAPKSKILQTGVQDVAVGGDINAASNSTVQVGNNNQINYPPLPKTLVPCTGGEGTFVVCNAEGTQVYNNRVFGGSPTSLYLNGADKASVHDNETHQLPSPWLNKLFIRGMFLSDDCQRKKMGNRVPYKAFDVKTGEDLRQGIVRWKNYMLLV